ncbi:MBL fold metallo-hydrolase [Niastella yeongjuensis]|uniref:MBL fold metallo-hydrolase n=1 Tax=Niastella yeongjuensis TaxID=354355 RepID=A0A1V9EF89_9BACT|nr:MBL fold metallo-hydrolase [Niastella yeongjuensis]OQP44624.1 MBL fold metallo-hydrolase [Niastella yeongjuensis]SEO80919.1 Phosphoribosyl 1,2-cyclic phosphodiesterase [Niastella yeongjuensis]
MSLYIASLNSGSNGNCYYVGNGQEAILVDAGISCRETERRMARIGLSMQTVKAIFVSHEHTDHISGIPVLAKKYQLPVYITDATLYNGNIDIKKEQVVAFKPYEPVQIGGLAIQAFPKFHDAAEPHSFIVNGNNVNIGIFTDIGSPCDHLALHFKHCHAAFLEANYDEEMLETGNYPRHLKNRIRGGHGHLSNKQALEVFTKHRPSYMSHLFLAHLSRDNNSPQLVKQLFNEHAGNTQIIVASRFEETAVYQVTAEQTTDSISLPKKENSPSRIKQSYTQLRLW